MFKLYTDKPESFECQIQLSGADIKKSQARLVIESTNVNLIYYGDIDSNGKCKVSINKLTGLLPEETTGKMHLEVIAEDTFFIPYETQYIVDASKKVKVEVITKTEQPLQENKKKITISNVNDQSEYSVKDASVLAELFNKNKITRSMLTNNKVLSVVKTYMKDIRLHESFTNQFVNDIKLRLKT